MCILLNYYGDQREGRTNLVQVYGINQKPIHTIHTHTHTQKAHTHTQANTKHAHTHTHTHTRTHTQRIQTQKKASNTGNEEIVSWC